ncbi:PPOX class F420-dependent oxidoreductase [Dactylosporangium siamense]|uniref:PPOX class F420-dependent oxidoreductase n=1 Tax=Dactylosporangium siamense TaxID=685454 RepID=A0A919UDV7_9ACTN|nr:PPOX class F420-dependent oxidoreductase [Dactylosporangium siamense]GIG51849.1 PPOX class F420-dependent oxidoreductase [Dactylosporangium siamense]
MSDSSLEILGRRKQASFTTFRKDGRPVATAVWLAIDDGQVVIVTEPGSGKVKRLRNSGRVLLAPSDIRGRVPAGAPSFEGTARLVEDPEGIARIRAAIARRYVSARIGYLINRLLRRPQESIGVIVTL